MKYLLWLMRLLLLLQVAVDRRLLREVRLHEAHCALVTLLVVVERWDVAHHLGEVAHHLAPHLGVLAPLSALPLRFVLEEQPTLLLAGHGRMAALRV